MREAIATGTSMIDIHVGMRLRLRRISLDLSIPDLAQTTGRDPATIEGWEQGEIRIGASELFELARLLEIPLAFFYDGLETGSLGGSLSTSGSLGQRVAARAGGRVGIAGRRRSVRGSFHGPFHGGRWRAHRRAGSRAPLPASRRPTSRRAANAQDSAGPYLA